ncbi:amidohydrolase family protein [Novosphingobium sp.]|uniref:amidohydrolase family protein n=1 Tax=Novosphingobium sp. TaxID=1874826 RepID=UPI0025D6511A|nr:amidohydrolase family protein [Novosphingobium sp.]
MSRFSRIAALLAASLVSTSAIAAPTDFAITNATVVLGDGSAPIPEGTVVVRSGKVVAAGANVSVPAGVSVIDGSGKWVSPGMVVAVTDLGLLDVGAVENSNDSGARKSPFSAALDVSAAIDPEAMPIRVSRTGGVTRTAVAPSAESSIFAGQGAYVDLAASGNTIDRPRAFQYVELGERGGRLAGGSRVSAQAILRNALREARDFARRAGPTGARRGTATVGSVQPASPEAGRIAESDVARGTDVQLTRADAAALVPVVNGTQPLFVHVERMADLRQTLALSHEFPALRLVIVGAAEGWRVADEIAAAHVPVIASGITDLPGAFETMAATQSNIGRMVRAGVRVAIGNMFDNDQPRYARQYAGNLVALTRLPGATGLTWGQAFAAISSVPAEIMGEGAHFGSLLPGHAADVVVWDGDPLELGSGAERVFIDGVEQPLDNHQTRLRTRYRHPQEGALPKAYEW